MDQSEDKEVDELLDFFENNEIEDFSQNEEIKHLLVNLKDKIEKMKADENWKEREAERMQKAKEARNRPQEDQEDDKYSNFHVANSEGKSVASEKTQSTPPLTQKSWRSCATRRTSSRSGTSSPPPRRVPSPTSTKRSRRTWRTRCCGTTRT